MELKNKIDSKKKLLHLNVGQLQKDILKYINNLRAQPNNFLEIIKRENPNPSKELLELINYLYSLNNQKIPPFKLDNDICKCTEDILSYIILYDEGKNEINFGPNNKEKFSLNRRLERIGKKQVENEEFIIYGINNPKNIINNILLNEPNMIKLFQFKYTLIGISCGILPSDRLCTIIDIVEEEKLFDSFKKYNNYNIENIPNPNMNNNNNYYTNYKTYNNNYNPNNNLYNRKNKNMSFSTGKKIPSNNNINGTIQRININYKNNYSNEKNYHNNINNYNSSENNYHNNINNYNSSEKNYQNNNNNNKYKIYLNNQELNQEEKPIITVSSQTNNTEKSEYNINNDYSKNYNSNYTRPKIPISQFKSHINKIGIPYSNKSLASHKRNFSYTNIKLPNPICEKNNCINIIKNDSNNNINNNINYNINHNINNLNNNYNINIPINKDNLKSQSSMKSLFKREEVPNVTYTTSIIPDIDGTYINVLTKNTKFKDGSKLIEYDTN